ncbi:MAG: hypothetical protein M3Y53_05875 [Thermoproteota archaeon]|nr:hypothetical protein [Thermoproteota archaeon]
MSVLIPCFIIISAASKKNVIADCIDDPKSPSKGVRGKGIVKIHEDVSHNMHISKKFIMNNIGTLDDPNA